MTEALSHFRTRYERRARTGKCWRMERVGDNLDLVDDLYWHVCHLSAGHYGPHVCDICGCAFFDDGRIFTQQPRLPGVD